MALDLVTMKANQCTVAAALSVVVNGKTVPMYGTSPYNVSAIPNTPFFVSKDIKGTNSPGNFEVLHFDLLGTLYIERLTQDDSEDDAMTIPWVIAFLAGYATHSTFGGTASMAYIREYDTGAYYPVGDVMYHAIDFVWDVIVAGQGVQYTVG